MRKDRKGKREGSHGSLGKSLSDRDPAMGAHGTRVSPVIKVRTRLRAGKGGTKIGELGGFFFFCPSDKTGSPEKILGRGEP